MVSLSWKCLGWSISLLAGSGRYLQEEVGEPGGKAIARAAIPAQLACEIRFTESVGKMRLTWKSPSALGGRKAEHCAPKLNQCLGPRLAPPGPWSH